MARLPIGCGIGLRVDQHQSYDGISIGSATVFDRAGPFGVASIVALANAERAVDMAARLRE